MITKFSETNENIPTTFYDYVTIKNYIPQLNIRMVEESKSNTLTEFSI